MPKIEIFDHSMISAYRLCPKRFFHRYMEHLESKTEARYIPEFGSAGHEALDARYKGKDYGEQVKAFADRWMPFEGKDPKKNRTMERGLIIVEEYDKRYPLDREPFTVHKDYVEVGFVAELQDYLICGKMDAIVEWRLGFKGLVVFEHKFSGSKGFLMTEPNHQIDTYIWGARQLIGEPIIGGMLNVVYHSRKGKKDGYYNDFEREFTERSEEGIKLWERDTLSWIESINRDAERNFWPRNPGSCYAFFKPCPYKELCKPSQRQNMEKMKEQLYVINKWEPYKDARKENN